MFKLWTLAEQDLLHESNRYQLTNTGQGLNRVQHDSNLGRAMHQLLHRCQQNWAVGRVESVLHLGDHNVPNALMFIDKYTQVPRWKKARWFSSSMRSMLCATTRTFARTPSRRSDPCRAVSQVHLGGFFPTRV